MEGKVFHYLVCGCVRVVTDKDVSTYVPPAMIECTNPDHESRGEQTLVLRTRTWKVASR